MYVFPNKKKKSIKLRFMFSNLNCGLAKTKTSLYNNSYCLARAFTARRHKRERSGRVLDSRPKGRGFEPHRRHCVVVLEQDTFILA